MARIVIHREGLTKLLRSQAVTDELMKVAEPIVEHAKATAPIGDKGDEHSGQYRDSIKATPRASSKRAWVMIGSDLPYAPKIQADTGHLASALDAGRNS